MNDDPSSSLILSRHSSTDLQENLESLPPEGQNHLKWIKENVEDYMSPQNAILRETYKNMVLSIIFSRRTQGFFQLAEDLISDRNAFTDCYRAVFALATINFESSGYFISQILKYSEFWDTSTQVFYATNDPLPSQFVEIAAFLPPSLWEPFIHAHLNANSEQDYEIFFEEEDMTALQKAKRLADIFYLHINYTFIEDFHYQQWFFRFLRNHPNISPESLQEYDQFISHFRKMNVDVTALRFFFLALSTLTQAPYVQGLTTMTIDWMHRLWGDDFKGDTSYQIPERVDIPPLCIVPCQSSFHPPLMVPGVYSALWYIPLHPFKAEDRDLKRKYGRYLTQLLRVLSKCKNPHTRLRLLFSLEPSQHRTQLLEVLYDYALENHIIPCEFDGTMPVLFRLKHSPLIFHEGTLLKFLSILKRLPNNPHYPSFFDKALKSKKK